MCDTEVLIQRSIDEFKELLNHPVFEPVFDSIERNYNVKRETVGYVGGAAVALYLVVGAAAQLLCNLIGFAYPAYVFMIGIRTNQFNDSLHWLTYWTIFASLSLVDFFDDEILQICPVYYLLKAIFLVWLQLPQTNATSFIYKNYIEQALKLLDQTNTDEPVKEMKKEPDPPKEPEPEPEPPKVKEDPEPEPEPPKVEKEPEPEPSYTQKKEDLPKEVRMMLNEWTDFKAGDPFPSATIASKAIRALNKSLDTLPDEQPDQYVALCYHHGEPIMGRVWNDNGKIAASFSWNGHDIRNKIESMMVLFLEDERGFDYDWRPYPEAASFEKDKIWHPVHVDMHGNVDISPGVITVDGGKQILGKVDVRNEKSSYGYKGKEYTAVGPAVHNVMVLCRKARPGFNFK